MIERGQDCEFSGAVTIETASVNQLVFDINGNFGFISSIVSKHEIMVQYVCGGECLHCLDEDSVYYEPLVYNCVCKGGGRNIQKSNRQRGSIWITSDDEFKGDSDGTKEI